MEQNTTLNIELGLDVNRYPVSDRLGAIVFFLFNAPILYLFFNIDGFYTPWELQRMEGLDLVEGWALFLFFVLCLIIFSSFIILIFFRKHGFILDKTDNEVIFWRRLFFRQDYRVQDSSEFNQVVLAKRQDHRFTYVLFLKKSADELSQFLEQDDELDEDEDYDDNIDESEEEEWEDTEDIDKKLFSGVLLGKFPSRQLALQVGQQASRYLNFPLTQSDKTIATYLLDRFEEHASYEVNISHKPQWLKTKVWLPLLLVALSVAAYTTPLWEMPFILALNPSFSSTRNYGMNKHTQTFRIYSASKLKSAQTDKAIIELARIVNTIDPKEQDKLMQASMNSLSAISGIQLHTKNPEHLDQSIGRINRWASERLSRPLDQNGGVFLWFELVPKYARGIDEIAGSNHPDMGWWSSFGIAEITYFSRREDWLRWAGKAFNDPRPLSQLLIKFGNDTFDFLNPRNDDTRHTVVGQTVGEAIAIRFWDSLSAAERGGKDFPADFRKWWNNYAAKHRLPPLPEEQS